MAFKFRCPFCNTKLEAEDEWEGSETTCPKCSHEIGIEREPEFEPEPPAPPVNSSKQTQVIPESTSSVEKKSKVALEPVSSGTKSKITLEPVPNNAVFSFICPVCGTIVELDGSFEGQEYECTACYETSIAKRTTEKKCPFCGKNINLRATICRFCKKPQKPFTPITSLSNAESAKTLTSEIKIIQHRYRAIIIGILSISIIIIFTLKVNDASHDKTSKETVPIARDSQSEHREVKTPIVEPKVPRSGRIKIEGHTPRFSGTLKVECCLNGSTVASTIKRFDGTYSGPLSKSVEFIVQATEGDVCKLQYYLLNQYGGVVDSSESKEEVIGEYEIRKEKLIIWP